MTTSSVIFPFQTTVYGDVFVSHITLISPALHSCLPPPSGLEGLQAPISEFHG